MASYKLTGMHSHRHPFLGDPVTVALAAAEEEQVTATPEDSSSWMSKLARPVVSGGVTGLVTYATCRAFSVTPKQSMQVSFVIAGLNVLVNLASDWIYGEMQQLVKDGGSAPVAEVLP